MGPVVGPEDVVRVVQRAHLLEGLRRERGKLLGGHRSERPPPVLVIARVHAARPVRQTLEESAHAGFNLRPLPAGPWSEGTGGASRRDAACPAASAPTAARPPERSRPSRPRGTRRAR